MNKKLNTKKTITKSSAKSVKKEVKTAVETQPNVKIKKAEIIKNIVEKTNFSKSNVEAIINAYTETISEAIVEGKSITLPGIGIFNTTNKPEKTYTTFGKTTVVPAHRSLKFKVSKTIKEKLIK